MVLSRKQMTGNVLTRIARCLAALLVLACLCPPVHSAEEPRPIRLLLSGEDPIYQAFARAFEARFPASVRLAEPGEPATPETALSIAVGAGACHAELAADGHRPLLCVLVPRPTFRELVERHGRLAELERRRISAIYLDQPLARQYRLLRLVVPRAGTVGVILGPATREQADALHAAARAADLELRVERVNGEHGDPVSALQALLPDVDALLAIPDPTVYNRYTIRPLLLATFRSRVPVIGFSESYVRAGAVAAVYSTPEQIGRQAAELAEAFLGGDRTRLPPPADPEHYSVGVNRDVAELLGLPLPDAAELETRLRGERN